MRDVRINIPAYVIKAQDLDALNYLPAGYPAPQALEWIDRGRNTKFRPATIDMLLRTLYHVVSSPSVRRLHDHGGLRVVMRTEEERRAFAAMFEQALSKARGDADQPFA
jgi:hypothetical protein